MEDLSGLEEESAVNVDVIPETPPPPPLPSTPRVREKRLSAELETLLADQRNSVHRVLSPNAGRRVSRPPPTQTELLPVNVTTAHPPSRPSTPPPPPSPPSRPRRSSRSSLPLLPPIPSPSPPKAEEEFIDADVEVMGSIVPSDDRGSAASSRGKRTAVRETEHRKAVASAEKSKNRKPRVSPPPPPVIDEEEQRKAQLHLLEHSHIPLSLTSSGHSVSPPLSPCSPLTSSPSAPPVKCKGDHPTASTSWVTKGRAFGPLIPLTSHYWVPTLRTT